MGSIPGKGFPLGPADRQHPDGVDAMLAARGRYLEAIEDHAPRVLADLAGEPLTLARQVPGWTTERLNTSPSPLAWGDEFDWSTICHPGHDGDPELVALRQSLEVWGARYGFMPRPGDGPGHDWGLDTALQTLGRWIAAGERFNPQRPTWVTTPGTAAYRPMGTLPRKRKGKREGEKYYERVGPGIGRAVETVLTPFETQITLPETHWNPQTENEAAFQRRMRENLSHMLSPEITRINSLAENKKRLPKAPRKYSDDHFRWTVLYQVEGRNFEQLADDLFKSSRDSVRGPVQKLARTMRLPLRPGQSGRPQKNL